MDNSKGEINRDHPWTVTDTLEEFRKTTGKKGWNGYDAEPIPGIVIDNAIALVKTLTYPPEVFPVATGEIQMEWNRSDGGYLEVTVSDDPQHVEAFIDIPKDNHQMGLTIPSFCVKKLSTEFMNGKQVTGHI